MVLSITLVLLERRPTYPLNRLRLYAGFTEVSGAVDVDTGYFEAVLLA